MKKKKPKEEKHCEKCSYMSDEGLVISGCAYCGCHFSSTIADHKGEDVNKQYKKERKCAAN